jgi:hypothetical protein
MPLKEQLTKEKLKYAFLLCLANLLWLIFRTGTKPTRISYPCQRAALNNLSISFNMFIPFLITTPFIKIKTSFSNRRKIVLALFLTFIICVGLFWRPLTTNQIYQNDFTWKTPEPFQEILLTLESKNATDFPASNIYVMNGQTEAHVIDLINFMGSHGLYFYNSNKLGGNHGSEGLIAANDVVLIKINSQWGYRGGTNTDLLKELIQAIIDHPSGFSGEIIVADNGQGYGKMDWLLSNAEDNTQSTQGVVNMFSSHNVSTFDWQAIRGIQVDEYSEGDITTGYVLYDTVDPETGIFVSYPKFETDFGTYISLKHGIWNGIGYEKRLKVINLPVLKSHMGYGVTASVKNYMGVQSESIGNRGGLANGHITVATGGMGTLMLETGLPTLNIIDAIWVNANPWPSSSTGPGTEYSEATRLNIIMAGRDPVALDYWAAKNVLIKTAELIGFSDTHTLDPDNTEKSGLTEAFGIWLNKSKNELIRGGYNFTTNINRMNVFVSSPDSSTSSISSTSSSSLSSTSSASSTSSVSSTNSTPGFESISVVITLVSMGFFYLRLRRIRFNSEKK